nr:uncharacterized protein LOC100178820 isoform X1 [Ciona intestinalis]|eukprot:XP_002126941.1 uncharacterized protein LOC100178820 isoform X1 [Ciona intestinalis]
MLSPGRKRSCHVGIKPDYRHGNAGRRVATTDSRSIAGNIKSVRKATVSGARILCVWMLLALLAEQAYCDEPELSHLRYARLRAPVTVNAHGPSATGGVQRRYYSSWRTTQNAAQQDAPPVQILPRPTTRSNRYAAYRKFQSGRSVAGRSSRRTSLMSAVNRLQDQIPALQTSIGHQKKRNRRILQHITKTKTAVRKLQGTCNELGKNITTTSVRLQRFIGEFHNHQAAARERMEQIEDHQTTQDQRHFQLYEKAINNSADISQLQAELDDVSQRIDEISEDKERQSGNGKSQDDITLREEIADVRNEMAQQHNTFNEFREQVNTEVESLTAERQATSQKISASSQLLRQGFSEQLTLVTASVNDNRGTLEIHAEKLRELKEKEARLRADLDSATEERRRLEERIGENEAATRGLQQRNAANLSRKVEEQTRSLVSRHVGTLTAAINGLNTSVRYNQYHQESCATRIEAVEEDLLALTERLDTYVTGTLAPRIKHRGATIQRNIQIRYNVSSTHGPHHLPNELRQLLMGRPSLRTQVEIQRTGPTALVVQTGMEERLERLSRTMRHYNKKLMNVTSLVQTMTGDVRTLAMRTAHYFNVINVQGSVIRKQNETLAWLVAKQRMQEIDIRGMTGDLASEQDTVMKLITIVTNLAGQLRRPIPQSRDCHDLWMSGHRKSGVYTIVRDMTTKPIYCNMTETAGWTVLQRRGDGTQDFDREWPQYKEGFGSIYGEHWLGLDIIRWMTHGRSYTLMIQTEDWMGNVKYAMYDQFAVFGQNYVLSIAGYSGGAGDSMTKCNDRPFQVREDSREMTITTESACTNTRRGGWWFPEDCGQANPNGPYRIKPDISEGGAEEGNGINDPTLMFFWMSWQKEANPIKSISMQMVPREALVENVFSTLPESENRLEEEEEEEEERVAGGWSEGGTTLNSIDGSDVDQYPEYEAQAGHETHRVTVQSVNP